MRLCTKRWSTIACAAAAAAHSPLHAADAPTAMLEEVVVTSRRVEERLQDTPIAVSAFQTADIEKLTLRNIGDAAAFTPNFLSNPGPTGGNDGFFFIRGVGQVDLNPSVDPGVATYIDGVYLGRVMGASLDSTDIARIEVLRGPQGTLFGRNTIGGAINITSLDPGEEFEASVLGGVGDRDLVRAAATLNAPLGETAGLRLSVNYRDQDGWGERARDGVIFDSNELKSARLKFKWAPSEAFAATLAADASDLTGTSQHTILTQFSTTPRPFVPCDVLYGTLTSPLCVPIVPEMAQYAAPADQYANNSSIAPDKDYEVRGVGLTFDFALGWADLKSISSYRTLEQAITVDYDSTPYSFYEGGYDTDQRQWSQELQLSGEAGRLRWLLGAFYYDEHDDHINIVSLGGNNGCLPPGPPSAGYPWPTCGAGQAYATPFISRALTNNQQFELDIEAQALFAQTTIRITDAWSTTLGVRWTEERKEQAYDFFIDNTAGVANGVGLPPGIIPTFSPDNPDPRQPSTVGADTWSAVTPKVSIEYQPSENFLYYASWSEGFKSGGFNGRPNPGPTGVFPPIEAYDPEEMQAWELGAKTQFADNRLRVNLAVFQSDYENIQLIGLGERGFFETFNAAESRIRGAELELQAAPTSAVELQLGLGYADNEYQELEGGILLTGVDYGMQLPLTPEFNGSFGAQYTWRFGLGALALRADYSYRSELYFEPANAPGNRQGGYGVVNARATYDHDAGRWSIALYGLNLADKVYRTNAQNVVNDLGVSFASISAPREWGVEARYRFGR